MYFRAPAFEKPSILLVFSWSLIKPRSPTRYLQAMMAWLNKRVAEKYARCPVIPRLWYEICEYSNSGIEFNPWV